MVTGTLSLKYILQSVPGMSFSVWHKRMHDSFAANEGVRVTTLQPSMIPLVREKMMTALQLSDEEY